MTANSRISSPFANRLRIQIAAFAAELSANPRLQFGLAGIALLAITTGLLALDDLRIAKSKQVERLHTENQQLAKRLGGDDRQRWLASRIESARTQIEHSQWQVSSPLMAQTIFSDWLSNELNESGVKELKVTQPAVRFIEASEDADSTDNKACDETTCSLVELRSTVRFAFDPETTTRALARIERADWPLKIDQLNIRTGERRVELTIKALARINKTEQVSASAGEATSPPAEQATAKVDPLPPGTGATAAPINTVEIKW